MCFLMSGVLHCIDTYTLVCPQVFLLRAARDSKLCLWATPSHCWRRSCWLSSQYVSVLESLICRSNPIANLIPTFQFSVVHQQRIVRLFGRVPWHLAVRWRRFGAFLAEHLVARVRCVSNGQHGMDGGWNIKSQAQMKFLETDYTRSACSRRRGRQTEHIRNFNTTAIFWVRSQDNAGI